MTRLIIRGVPGERLECVEYLQAVLPEAEWVWDEKRDAMDTFLRALDAAGGDPAVHLEEDILLTTEFVPKLEAVIAEHPDSIINFFSRRKDDAVKGSRWDRFFTYNVCHYLPAGYGPQIRAYWPHWSGEPNPNFYDYMISDWLRTRREPYWLHVPSLVQHREMASLMGPRSSRRQSVTFQP